MKFIKLTRGALERDSLKNGEEEIINIDQIVFIRKERDYYIVRFSDERYSYYNRDEIKKIFDVIGVSFD